MQKGCCLIWAPSARFLEDNGYVFDLWPGMDGTGFIPANKLAIAAGSSQTELAKSFVKMMLSTENPENEFRSRAAGKHRSL